MKPLLTALFSLLSVIAFSQNPVWRPSNLPLKVDTASALEDTTGSTTVTFYADHFTQLINFPGGFSFRYGLDSFQNFSVTKYGYIRLGTVITSISAESQDDVIAPFYTLNSFPNVKYKLTGTAPYRKFIIEWNGNFTPTSQFLRFQLVLHEKNGKIQMLHSGVNAYATTNTTRYQLLLRHSFYNVFNMVNVDVVPPPQQHTVTYKAYTGFSLGIENTQAIYPLSRFTFQPDTVKPVTPTAILFQNVMPGCMNIVPVYDSSKAYTAVLSKRYGALDFKRLSVVPAGQFFYDSLLWAQGNYQFGINSSNGFVTSDTFVQAHQMPVAQISGTKMIPGDYPNITALLEDAKCKQLGPNLVIELQNNYSFALEPNTVTFTSRLRSPAIQHIIIRPAAGASLVLNIPSTKGMFVIDSMAHVEFDGRAGGVGSTPAMTFRSASVLPAVKYAGAADSGEVRYCMFESNTSTVGTLNLAGYSNINSANQSGCNNVYIHHNKFGPASGTVEKLLVCEGGYQGTGTGLRIEDNEFFRSSREAVTVKSMPNAIIKSNRFYQPDSIVIYGTACVRIEECGLGTLVEGNKFGGNAPSWGNNTWVTSSGDYYFIYVLNGATLRYNEFGNIRNKAYQMYMIYSQGVTTMHGNKIGTTDSIGSINGSNHLFGFRLTGGGQKIVDSNLVSGLTCKGELGLAGVDSYSPTPVSYVTDNDFGGSDNYDWNTGVQRATALSVFPGSTVIRNNIMRGLSSSTGTAIGIDGGSGILTPGEGDQQIENNQIHHIKGKLLVFGINLNLNSNKTSSVTGNSVYAIRGVGPFLGTPVTSMNCGIYLKSYQMSIPFDSMTYVVKNNVVQALDFVNATAGAQTYPITGISVMSTHKSRISNNVIRLGFTTTGAVIDTIEAFVTGMSVEGLQVDVSHNSLFLGGTGGKGIKMVGTASFKKNLYLSNNIVMIHKTKVRPGNPDDIYFEAGYPSPTGTVNSIVSNKNIWYSPNDPNLATKLAAWRTRCHCDSATFTADPKFIIAAGDSSQLNLHLGSLSAADSAGTPPAFAVDYDKDSLQRSLYSPVDIGAYAATPCATGQVPQITLNPNAENLYKCPSASVTLTATVSGAYSSLVWQKDFNDIAGANGLSYVASQPGSYRLVAKYPCGQTASIAALVQDSVISNINAQITASPSAQVCPNIPVTLTVNSTNCPTCTYTWSTGPTGNSITVTAAGSYSVIANSGCGSKTVSQQVTIYPTPTITLVPTPTATICAGGYTNIYAWGADNYVWSPTTGLTSAYGPTTGAAPASTTTYTVTGSLNGCAASQSITITVNPLPNVSVSPVSPTICAGGSVTLNANGAGAYEWSPSTGLNTTTSGTVIASPAATTTYKVKGTTSGCADSTTVVVSVNPTAAPHLTITNSGCPSSNIVFNAVASNGGTSPVISWYVNNILSGTGATYTLANVVNGTKVHASLSSSLTCATPQSVQSDTTVINCITTAIPQVEGLQTIIVSPNPTAGIVFVKMQLLAARTVSFVVQDELGRPVYESMPVMMSGTVMQQIDLNRVAQGTYYLKTVINDKTVYSKIIVQR